MSMIRTIPIALTLIAVASAVAAEGRLTREQVKAELAEAQRTGDIVANGEAGQKLNELHPGRYPAKPPAPGKTRAEVRAELVDAQRAGEIIGNGETGQKLNELYPGRYPPKPVMAGKTRAEVKAELAEAIRTGDIIANGETGLKQNELSPGLYPMQTRGRMPTGQAAAAQREATSTR